MKSKARKTTNKIQDYSVKVKDYRITYRKTDAFEIFQSQTLLQDDTDYGFWADTSVCPYTVEQYKKSRNTRDLSSLRSVEMTRRTVSLGRHAGQPLQGGTKQAEKK